MLDDRRRLAAPLIAIVVAAAAVLLVLGLVVVPHATDDGDGAATTAAPARADARAIDPPAAPADASERSAADELVIPAGPADASPASLPRPLVPLGGGDNAAAVLAADQAGAAVALRWLDGAGVPAAVASGVGAATAQAVIVLRAGAPAPAEALGAFVRRGGVLVAEAPLDPAIATLAALPEATVRPRPRLRVLAGGGLAAVDAPLPQLPVSGWSVADGAIARYPDGAAAIVAHRVGRGVVATLGVPLEALALPVPAAADPDAPAPLPGAVALGARDVGAALARALHGLSPTGVTLGPAPGGAAAALVIEHDLDRAEDAAGLADLVRAEADRTVDASVFVAAQWLDGATPAVLDARVAAVLADAQAAGAQLESGGVVPGDPRELPPGTGEERAPGYAPAGDGGGRTLAGEARVGRHALLAAVPAARPVAFRAATPGLLPAGDALLAAAGFAVDASPLADEVGGSSAYASLGAGTDAATTDGVLVVPLAVDDRVDDRPDRAVERLLPLLPRRAALGATTAVRISPRSGDAALTAVRRLLAAVPDGVWTGSVADLAAWHAARAGLRVDVRRTTGGGLRIELVGTGERPAGTLLLPFAAASVRVVGDGAATLSPDRRRIATPPFAERLVLEVAPPAGA